MLKRIFLLLAVFAVFTSCKNEKSTHKSIDTKAITFTKEGELTFYRAGDSTKLKKIAIEVAKTPYERQTGLMYRKHMEEGQGMLFVFKNEQPRSGFYMKNTYIALDLIYINAQKTIVDFNENAQPLDQTPMPSTAPAQYVLEVNAGMVEKWGIAIGDSVSFQIN